MAVCGVGVVHVFDRAEDQTAEFYRLLRTVHVPQDPGRLAVAAEPSLQEGITGLAVSPSEETLVAASTRSQLYVISMSSVFLSSKVRRAGEVSLRKVRRAGEGSLWKVRSANAGSLWKVTRAGEGPLWKVRRADAGSLRKVRRAGEGPLW